MYMLFKLTRNSPSSTLCEYTERSRPNQQAVFDSLLSASDGVRVSGDNDGDSDGGNGGGNGESLKRLVNEREGEGRTKVGFE